MPKAGGELHPVDAWWTVLAIDPFAIRLVRLVRPMSWVTPMRLTLTAHALGVLTAVLFATGHLLAAAVLYEVRFLLDCMDGKLARSRGTTSAVGGFLDFVGDYLVTAVNLAGIGLWLHWEAGSSAALAVAPPAMFLAHIAVRLSSEAQGTMRRVSDSMPGRYASWMSKRRLAPAPARIDIEHAVLFVLPVAAVISGRSSVMTAGALLASAYFTYVMVRFLQGGVALARSRDDEVIDD